MRRDRRFPYCKRPRLHPSQSDFPYRFRAQVETVMSMQKRSLDAARSAKTYQDRRRDLILRVLMHSIMIALI